MVVKAKKTQELSLMCFGDMYGCSVVLDISPEQKWEAKKKGKYWWLKHKGRGYQLRLTDKAMHDCFKEVTE